MLKIEDEYELRDLITQIPELMIDSQDANGEYLSLRVRFALIRRESGFISGLVAVLHDTTEQRRKSVNGDSLFPMLVMSYGRL